MRYFIFAIVIVLWISMAEYVAINHKPNTGNFITVDQMNCLEVTKTFSKRQLSELTQEEKFLVRDATECGVTYQNVRILKSRIRAYQPHYSIELWRTDKKYENDPGGPLHVTKTNIEYCEIAIGGENGKASWIVIAMTCNQLDEVLK